MKTGRAHILLLVLCFVSIDLYALSSLAPNDPYPVYTSIDPQDFLFLGEKLKISDPTYTPLLWHNVMISISPFGQNAQRGRDLAGNKVYLGDIAGRWGMIPLLYGPIPNGQTMAPALVTALNNLFPGVAPGDANDATKIDPSQNFGYFSVPLKYGKRGVRFELDGNLIGGFGINLETGVVCMTQTVTGFIDDTVCSTTFDCKFDPAPITADSVEAYLMQPLKTIAEQIQLDISSFSAISIEEVRLNLYWRKPFELNRPKPAKKSAIQHAMDATVSDDEDEEYDAHEVPPENNDGYPYTVFFPYFEISGSVSPGQPKEPGQAGFNKRFILPFGNNGHSAVGFTGGIAFDFIESIELASEIGVTYFLKKNFDNFRLPTSIYQSGIYPFRTDVSISPGINWHFTAKIGARHFLGNLSTYFEYVQLEHKPDNVRLRKCEDASVFLPEVYEPLTAFKTKVANIALNYDISPNIGLGIFWQAPLGQANSYKSSTVLFSFNAQF